MRALQVIKLGPIKEAFVYKEGVAKPTLKLSCQVLVRVKAASVNPIEVKMSSGNIKFSSYFTKVPTIFGSDFSGVIEAKGDQVDEFQIGDEVFGALPCPSNTGGTFAEYTVVDIRQSAIAKKPRNITHEEAASAGVAALTAYAGVVQNGGLVPDQTKNVLIVGASGGVGAYAVQIVKAINSANMVVGICSGRNASFVRSMGANRVVDYTDVEAMKKFVEGSKGTFDIVFDCVGGNGYYDQLQPTLKNKIGVYSTSVGPVEHVGSLKFGIIDAISMVSKIAYKKLFASHAYHMVCTIPLTEFKSKIVPLFESKALQAPMVHSQESVFNLKDGQQALEKVASHRATGKIVLKMD
jgi:NADPH:quinone reductase-like Zn-dependent oxidoreductase